MASEFGSFAMAAGATAKHWEMSDIVGVPEERERPMGGEELMRKIVAAFAQSDLQPLLNALHEDVVWKSASKQPGLFSFAGEYKNRSGILQVMANISKDYTFRSMEPKEIIAAGDVVWGYYDVELCYDAKGEAIEPVLIQLDMVFRWRLRDGKIIEHSSFFDTAHLLMQQKNLRPGSD